MNTRRDGGSREGGVRGKEDEETREDREVEDEEEKDRGKSKTRIYPRRDTREEEEDDSVRERGKKRERDEGPKETRESRNAFSSFSPSGHQSEAPAIRASQPESNEITRIYIL